MDRFTPEQIREYNDAFVMFDVDGSGDIGVHELREMLKTIGFNPPDDVLEIMTIVIDEDGNGMITFDEFINLIDGLETFDKNEGESREAFNAFDFEGRGFIDSTDIMEALKFVLDTRSTKELDEVVRFFSLVPCRKIEFKEFQSMIMTWGHSTRKQVKWGKFQGGEISEKVESAPSDPILN